MRRMSAQDVMHFKTMQCHAVQKFNSFYPEVFSSKQQLLNLLRVAWIKTGACFAEVTQAGNINHLTTIIKEKSIARAI